MATLLSALAAVAVTTATLGAGMATNRSTTSQSSLPDPPAGGVWMFGVMAYSPITELHARSVDLKYQGSKVTSTHTIPLAFNSTLVPATRAWVQDTVNGRLVMWHTIYGSAHAGECALETITVREPPHAPTLQSTWIVPEKYCQRGARLALNPRTPSAVYAVLRVDIHPTTNPILIRITGPATGVGPAKVDVISSTIPLGVSGAITIDPFFHNLYIINTSLLVSTQNLVKVSLISGDVTVESRPIVTDTTRLSSVEFNPRKLDEAYGSANYNSQDGRIARVDVSSTPWKVTKYGYTPTPYSFKFDFTSDPITAYGGSGSSCRWYDMEHTNPPLAAVALSGSFNYGTVFPYTK
eukprot:m.16844 g.16844  ORF g.16844 m.16844 type:complete len:352 (-) comp9120_c0_seq1:56-1111(-)